MYLKEDDIDERALFGDDSSDDGAPVEQGEKKRNLNCPKYPKLKEDGKVREVKHFARVQNRSILTLIGNPQMYFTRIATVFGIQPKPFHPSSYDGSDQEPAVKVDDYGQTKYRAAPGHVIRWRHTRNNKGQSIKQSNAKLVRWSDGSLCLYVGSERFAVSEANLPMPYRLATASEESLQTQGEIPSRMMFQPTSKNAAKRGAMRATSGSDEPIIITSKAQTELKARMDAQDESIRLTQQASRKRRGGPGGSYTGPMDAEFLEEGNDLGATKAHFKSRANLAREAANSKRLSEIKDGRKKQKVVEDEEESEDDSFIASEGEPSEEDFSDEE